MKEERKKNERKRRSQLTKFLRFLFPSLKVSIRNLGKKSSGIKLNEWFRKMTHFIIRKLRQLSLSLSCFEYSLLSSPSSSYEERRSSIHRMTLFPLKIVSCLDHSILSLNSIRLYSGFIPGNF